MTNAKHLAGCYSICLAPARVLSSVLVSILALARINHRLLPSNLAPARINSLAVLRLLGPFDPSRVASANRPYTITLCAQLNSARALRS